METSVDIKKPVEIPEEIDLTQDDSNDDDESFLVEILPYTEPLSSQEVTPNRCLQSQESPISSPANDPDSIDAVLARARSLIRDLNEEFSQSESKEENCRSLKEVPETELIDEKNQENEPPEICVIIPSDEEMCEEEAQSRSSSPCEKEILGTSVLNGLSKLVDWSKDQFSLEMQVGKRKTNAEVEVEAPMEFEMPDYFDFQVGQSSPTPSDGREWYDEEDQEMPREDENQGNSNVIDLCDDDDDDAEVGFAMKQISPEKTNFSRNIEREKPLLRLQSPVTKEIPISQLIIRTECVTPPPNYKAMSPNKLKGELQRFGVKSLLPPTKAVKLLEHIYTQLHPLISEDVDLTDLQSNPLNETARNLEAQLGLENLSVERREAQREVVEQPPKKPLRSRPKVKLTCEYPMELAFRNRLKIDRSYHEMILQYQPIELKELMAYFKSIGVKCDAKDVILLLDLHCITYRTVEPIGKAKNVS